jgi:hypothetical protein
MDGQFSEGLPGLTVDYSNKRFFFDTSRDLDAELELFFLKYLEKDFSHFRISEGYASGLHTFLEIAAAGLPKRARYIKGAVTGPLTAGSALKDETGKDIIHNALMFDVLVKGLAMKAAWQVESLKALGLPVIIFIDEPAMESLGSAFSSVSPTVVSGKLDEIIDLIHEVGGIAGIHCCGNADWSMVLGTRADIVNFDAFGYADRVLLYPDALRGFYARGGALAWGIVPTGSGAGEQAGDTLLRHLEASMRKLEGMGIDRATILRQALITPSCGMGSLSPSQALGVLDLNRQVSDRMKERI